MASISTIFRPTAEKADEGDKLKDLFRNRAALKKEFAALRNEKDALLERIKFHEGATARVQQKLDHVENLLLDPEWMYNVVAFYQLRRLGEHLAGKVERFAEKLKQQREKRVNDIVRQRWNQRREGDAVWVRDKLDEVSARLHGLEERLATEREALESMGRLRRFFRAKARGRVIAGIEAEAALVRAKEKRLHDDLGAIENRAPPDVRGLDVATKRSINFMILAFAQQLYLHYRDDDLVALAKEAGEKSVGAVNYGGKADCDRLLELIARRRKEAEKQGDFVEIMKSRAKMIANEAHFRSETDAVPVPASVSTIFDIGSNGAVQKSDGNLLGENYFRVAKILSR